MITNRLRASVLVLVTLLTACTDESAEKFLRGTGFVELELHWRLLPCGEGYLYGRYFYARRTSGGEVVEGRMCWAQNAREWGILFIKVAGY